MNGYELSRQWFAFAYESKEAKPAHTALYFWIVERANASGWKKLIDIQTEKSMECLGITDWRTYKNALQFLADHNFIVWVEKSRNQYTCNRVSLVLKEGELSECYKSAYANFAQPDAEAIAEALVEAYAEAHVEAIAEALQSYINLKTLKPNKPLNLETRESAPSEKEEGKVVKLPLEDEEKKAPPDSAAPPQKPKKGGGLVLFRDTQFIDVDIFAAAFLGTDYEYADLRFYHEVILNWSDSKSNKKVDWIATARNWMLRDRNDGKLRLRNGTQFTANQKGTGSASDLGSMLNDYVARRNRAGNSNQR